MKYEPVELPKFAEGLFATVACDAGSVATIVSAANYHDGPPMTILHWSIDDLSPRTLSRIVRATQESMTHLYEDIRVLYRPGVIRIDPAGAGQPLFEQANAAGFGVELLTKDGAGQYPELVDRVLAASYYLTCGAVSLARTAFERSIPYRGVTANHLTRALRAFGTSKQQSQPSVLLVALVDAVLEAFADPQMKCRATLDLGR